VVQVFAFESQEKNGPATRPSGECSAGHNLRQKNLQAHQPLRTVAPRLVEIIERSNAIIAYWMMRHPRSGRAAGDPERWRVPVLVLVCWLR
jgi:hypothetical protein